MARTLTDVLVRRTGIGTLDDPGDEILECVAQIAAGELSWSKARIDQELETAKVSLAVPG